MCFAFKFVWIIECVQVCFFFYQNTVFFAESQTANKTVITDLIIRIYYYCY